MKARTRIYKKMKNGYERRVIGKEGKGETKLTCNTIINFPYSVFIIIIINRTTF